MSAEHLSSAVQPIEAMGRSSDRLQPDIEWVRLRAEMYNSDSLLIPTLAAEQGVTLSDELAKTLQGESLSRSAYHTEGLAFATNLLGEAINKQVRKNWMFRNIEYRYKTRADTEGSYDESVPIYPSKETLDTLSENPYAGKSGQLFFGMLRDTIYPYTKQSEDGYVEVSARAPKVSRHSKRYQSAESHTANLCANTETHFMADMQNENTPLRSIKVDGAEVAIQKHEGDHTALATKPLIINGVRIPIGSVLTVEGNEESGYSFGFGRLTAFSFEDPEEAAREFPMIFIREGLKNEINRFGRFSVALKNFRYRAGLKTEPHLQTAVQEYAERHDLSFEEAAAGLCAETEAYIAEDRVARTLRTFAQQAETAAETAWNDKEAYKASDFTNDPATRRDNLSQLANSRLRLARTYGMERIHAARKVLSLNSYVRMQSG